MTHSQTAPTWTAPAREIEPRDVYTSDRRNRLAGLGVAMIPATTLLLNI